MQTQTKPFAAAFTALVLLSEPLLSAKRVGDDFQAKLSESARIHHVLDRLTFGARAGDMERVRSMGLEKWVDEQLNPQRIPENPILESKLKPLASLTMSGDQLLRNYPSPQALRLMANGMMPLPENPLQRAGVEKALERYRNRKAEGKETGEAKEPERVPAVGPNRPRSGDMREKLTAILEPAQLRTLRSGTPDEKSALLAALPENKLDELLIAMPAPMRRAMASSATPEIRRKLVVVEAPGQVIAYDLNEAKLQRAIYSNRQLEELLADFWYNHFNVYLDKGQDRHLVTSYERDAIRPHVLGKFKDLLLATAHHPAMLFYLDNWQSVGIRKDAKVRPSVLRRPAAASRGLNENYARELLELHTLGVDGGYTQKDVTEVARCFTGWTIRDLRGGGEFFFDERRHDDGEKTVLGQKIAAGGGKGDGERVLEILLKHPSTARFISQKLAVRFVADEPPAELVKRMAETFTKTGGDLRAVMKTMVLSKEFSSVGAYRAKIKTPFEMVVSAARALNADVASAAPLARQLNELGQPLYRKVEPTGYPARNAEWVNTSALVGRMNFALSLAQGKLPGIKPSIEAAATRERLEKDLVPAGLSTASRGSIEKALAGQETSAQLIAGLLLGSPEFQRR